MRKATGLVMQRMADRTARRVSLVHAHQVTPAAISGYAPNSLGAFLRCLCNCRCPAPLRAQIRPSACPKPAAVAGMPMRAPAATSSWRRSCQCRTPSRWLVRILWSPFRPRVNIPSSLAAPQSRHPLRLKRL
jgi:hypothetical protein